MENASKALIIAGAILLSILIISLGLMVYNQARDTVGSVNLSQQEIEAFNAKFTSYEGEIVSGSQVNSLIQTVISSNQAESDASTDKFIKIVVNGTTIVNGTTVTPPARVTPGKNYQVVFTYSSSIVIEEAKITTK